MIPLMCMSADAINLDQWLALVTRGGWVPRRCSAATLARAYRPLTGDHEPRRWRMTAQGANDA